jgi:hypothetical protein
VSETKVSLLSLSKTVRRVSLAAVMLMLGAAGSCYIGDRNWETEVQERSRQMAASGFYISDGHIESNMWQIVGTGVLFVGLSVAIAAFMLWRQDRLGTK